MEISSEANKVKEEAEEVRKAWQELDVSKTAQELQVWLSMYDLFVDTSLSKDYRILIAFIFEF